MSPRLGAAILLTIGSLTGLNIQLLNDDTPGTGNLSPVSIISIAVAGCQIAWFVAFLRKKEPRDDKHQRAANILGAVIIAGLVVYVLVQLANGTAAPVIGYVLSFACLMMSLSVRSTPQNRSSTVRSRAD